MSRSRLAFALLPLLLLFLAACSVTTAPPTPAPAAAPAARAASDLVNVYIESQPSAAEIWIDGEFVGSTNISYAVAPGKRAIELRKSGFESWKRELTVRAGSPTRIRADLTPLPRS